MLTTALQSIAPNLIILRIALGKSFTVDTTARSLPQSTEFKLSALRSPQDSVVTDSALSETVQDQFRGFTYNPANEHLSESVSYPSAMG